jgi:hypothetical protein
MYTNSGPATPNIISFFQWFELKLSQSNRSDLDSQIPFYALVLCQSIETSENYFNLFKAIQICNPEPIILLKLRVGQCSMARNKLL